MKNSRFCIFLILFTFLAMPVGAQYTSQAYGGTGNESFLIRTSDWFATLGMSQDEKFRTLHERRTARKIKKAKKKIEKRKQEIAKKKKALKNR